MSGHHNFEILRERLLARPGAAERVKADYEAMTEEIEKYERDRDAADSSPSEEDG